jgi:hypothetical protein
MQRYELEKLSREELIVHASQLGVPRPRVLTQPELMDEIITRTAKSEREKARRGAGSAARGICSRRSSRRSCTCPRPRACCDRAPMIAPGRRLLRRCRR